MTGEDAVLNLNSLGYTKIAFFKYGLNKKVNLRQKGYCKGIERLGLQYKKIITYPMSKNWLKKRIQSLLSKENRPEVIIFDWHPAAVLAQIVMSQIDLELVNKVKILVFDPGILEQEIGFYAMVQPLHEIVETSVELLTAKEWKCKTINIQAKFINYGGENE